MTARAWSELCPTGLVYHGPLRRLQNIALNWSLATVVSLSTVGRVTAVDNLATVDILIYYLRRARLASYSQPATHN